MGTFDFLKRWNSKPSIKKRLRKLLNSFNESFADKQYVYVKDLATDHEIGGISTILSVG